MRTLAKDNVTCNWGDAAGRGEGGQAEGGKGPLGRDGYSKASASGLRLVEGCYLQHLS